MSNSADPDAYRCIVNCVLDKWQALSMAVEHSFGGRYSSEKAEWMKDVVSEFLTCQQSARSRDEVEDYLACLMDQEFDTIVDDGSLTEISAQLVELWHKWKSDAKLPTSAPDTSLLTEEGKHENKTETEEARMTKDDDGWTVVSRQR